MISINLFKIPEDVWVEKIAYPAKCYSWVFVNRWTYTHSQRFVSFLFRNIIETGGLGVISFPMEFKEGKVFINSQEFGATESLKINHLFRFTALVQKAFIDQGFSFSWSIPTIVHHSQIMNVQNEAKKNLEALGLLTTQLRMRKALVEYNDLSIKFLPDENRPVKEIREFLENPENSSCLDNVKALDLSQMGYQQVPFGINRFKNIITLCLNNNALTHVPRFALLHLKYLYLRNNQLSTFPKIFDSYPSLKTIYLCKNKIEVFSPDLSSCPKLEILFMERCKLTKFNPNLTNSRSLRVVKLGHNKLQKFSANFKGCVALELLQVNNNQLKTFSSNLNHCPDLMTLDLEHNKISTFPLFFIKGCRKMDILLDQKVDITRYCEWS